jgi:hypothetical protein
MRLPDRHIQRTNVAHGPDRCQQSIATNMIVNGVGTGSNKINGDLNK